MTPDVSYIIPVSNNGKPDFAHRCKNLQFIIDNFLKRQQEIEFEVIFVEQVVRNGLKQYRDVLTTPSDYRFITVQYPEYNKCWALNIGAWLAKAPILMMAEADMYSSDCSYIQRTMAGFRAIANKHWCFGWDRLKYMTEVETHEILKNRESVSTIGNIQMPRPSGPEGGILIFNREWYLKIGGHNEWIQGLGGTDNEMADRAKWWSKSYKTLPHLLYHLWHPYVKTQTAGSIGPADKRQKNRQIIVFQRKNMEYIAPRLARQDIGKLDNPLHHKKTYAEMRTEK